MDGKVFRVLIISFLFGSLYLGVKAQDRVSVDSVANGIYRLSVGVPEQFTPYKFSPEKPNLAALNGLSKGELPFLLDEITMEVTDRGGRVRVPLQDDEKLYGFGLQIGSFQQRGLKKKPVVNDHPMNTLGYTHAPQPFYVSSKGYGILVNTLRYTTFYCGTHTEKQSQRKTIVATGEVKATTEELYANKKAGSYVYVDIPNCSGVEIFVFKASSMKQ